ncbi:DHH family phosphoesterase [Ligilactobacillus cholophilus]|uniref:DHH family phosphoesterase n=1 Tax=Ligilactobacillus cholophilus TaxID=3050131 RepID=UPI0025B07B78|nr:bifunctional oligoribonuclease/PAP phosphatase NrnA [Ligilactobacillus cholophilus]
MSIQADIIEQIEKFKTIIIHRHEDPDPDAFGSQAGLAEVIRNCFPDKNVYQVGENNASLEWITTEDKIDDKVYDGALVIVIDTANTPRIDDQRYKKGAFLIKIDHHPNDDAYGDLTWVKTDASSSSELIIDLVNNSNGKLVLNKKAAEALYAGIIGDTGRFMFNNTSAHTLRVTAQLFEFGIDAAWMNRKLDEITPGIAKLSAYVWDNMTITEHHAAYIVLKHDLIKNYKLGAAGTAPIVSVLGKIDTVKCWTLFVQEEDGTYRLNIRSKGPIINGLAKEYGGGGHPLASGAKMDTLTDEQLKEYVAKLDKIAATYTGEDND